MAKKKYSKEVLASILDALSEEFGIDIIKVRKLKRKLAQFPTYPYFPYVFISTP